jgi:hypothetical protein
LFEARAETQELTVASDGRFDVYSLVARMARGDEIFVAVFDPLDGPM